MADGDHYEKAKQTLSQIDHILESEPLTRKQRDELEIHAARLAGVIHHPWFPVSWPRRLIMVGIVVLGIQQAIWIGNYQPFVWWLILPFFSPRVVGYGAYYVGYLSRLFR